MEGFQKRLWRSLDAGWRRTRMTSDVMMTTDDVALFVVVVFIACSERTKKERSETLKRVSAVENLWRCGRKGLEVRRLLERVVI